MKKMMKNTSKNVDSGMAQMDDQVSFKNGIDFKS